MSQLSLSGSITFSDSASDSMQLIMKTLWTKRKKIIQATKITVWLE